MANFPTEMVNLPSKGKLYPKTSPLSKGEVELKYMTAKEEDILTSKTLMKKNPWVQCPQISSVQKLLESVKT